MDLLRLPDAPRVVFERPPLVLAICQVKFARVLSVVDRAFVAPFQRAIRHQYPVAVQARGLSVQLDLGSKDSEVIGRTAPPRWQFSDKQQDWTVVLAEDFCAIECRAYDRFDDFLARLQQVLDALTQHIEPDICQRIGLRYINEIRLDDISERDAINPQALGVLASTGLVGSAESVVSMQQHLLRYPDHQGINIHHGRLPGGSTIQPKLGQKSSENRGPFFLIDFDVFREFPLPNGLEMKPEMICEYVADYHRVIDRLFRWWVTDAYVATLGVRRSAGE